MTDRPSAAGATESTYPGERLGLPPAGPGSVASWGRRILALLLDWTAATLAASVLFGYRLFAGPTAPSDLGLALTPHLVFLLEATVFTALVGGSFGQVVLRVAVVRVDGKPVNVLQALLRTALIILVIPPLVFNRDRRGLHDLAVGTIALRR